MPANPPSVLAWNPPLSSELLSGGVSSDDVLAVSREGFGGESWPSVSILVGRLGIAGGDLPPQSQPDCLDVESIVLNGFRKENDEKWASVATLEY